MSRAQPRVTRPCVLVVIAETVLGMISNAIRRPFGDPSVFLPFTRPSSSHGLNCNLPVHENLNSRMRKAASEEDDLSFIREGKRIWIGPKTKAKRQRYLWHMVHFNENSIHDLWNDNNGFYVHVDFDIVSTGRHPFSYSIAARTGEDAAARVGLRVCRERNNGSCDVYWIRIEQSPVCITLGIASDCK